MPSAQTEQDGDIPPAHAHSPLLLLLAYVASWPAAPMAHLKAKAEAPGVGADGLTAVLAKVTKSRFSGGCESAATSAADSARA